MSRPVIELRPVNPAQRVQAARLVHCISAEERAVSAFLSSAGDAVPASARMPFAFRHISFETVRATRAIQVVRKVYEGDDYAMRAVILEGGVGCGKTYALRAYQRARLIENAGGGIDQIHFFDFPELSRRLLDRAQCAATMETCREADDLILDDLGSGYCRPGGFVQSCVEEIVIHREARQYPVVAATNLSPGQFRKLFGERVFDRLRGQWGAWVHVGSPSLRRKGSRR